MSQFEPTKRKAEDSEDEVTKKAIKVEEGVVEEEEEEGGEEGEEEGDSEVSWDAWEGGDNDEEAQEVEVIDETVESVQITDEEVPSTSSGSGGTKYVWWQIQDLRGSVPDG